MTIHKNKKMFFIIIILILVLITFSISLLYIKHKTLDETKATKSINNDNKDKKAEDIESITEQFIKYLFANNKNEAGNLSLGVVRYNILSNNIEIERNFEIKRLNTNVVFSSDELAIAKSTIEYLENIENEHDVLFYEVRLLKENNEWKVYYLNEEEPSINYDNGGNISLDNSEELNRVFSEYIETLSAGEYEKAAQYLIGRSKKMHKKANSALNEINLINKIRDIENNVVYNNGNIAISKFNYINSDRLLSVLVYFYLTGQGWKIYNVNQI